MDKIKGEALKVDYREIVIDLSTFYTLRAKLSELSSRGIESREVNYDLPTIHL